LITGKYRFTIGVNDLIDGVPLVPMVMGLFGVGEILNNLGNPNEISFIDTKVKDLLPNFEDWKKSIGPILRGSFLGFGLGIIPGGGAVLASFIDYTVEKRISKNPERFGNGAIEGVAGPETANNAACTGSFIPLLAFGIPSNVVIALLLGALLIHGITPGPLFIQKNPDIFWGLIASMYFGNVMLLILNLPVIPLWVKLLKIPYAVLFPLILLFCLIGVYSINNNIFDIFVMILCAVAGYFLNKLQYEFAPLVLAFILGPMLENSFRQSLIISNGSFWVFIQKPVSAICIGLSFILLATSAISFVKKIRGKVAE
jgi:putative tricarboxylic transport membrane protein